MDFNQNFNLLLVLSLIFFVNYSNCACRLGNGNYSRNGKYKVVAEYAAEYLNTLESRYSAASNLQVEKKWTFLTNMTVENAAAYTVANNDYFKFLSDVQSEIILKYPNWKKFKNPKLRREFKYLVINGPAAMPVDEVNKRNELVNKMEISYASATVCEFKHPDNCKLRLDPEIGDKLSTSTDYEELSHYWTEWHNAMSRAVKPSEYSDFIGYETKMAKANGFDSMSELWVAPYDNESKSWTAHKFKQEMLQIWEQLKPYYNKIHAYVRMKLRTNPKYKNKIKKYGYLPAHLMGNMWAQDWSSLDATTKPFPNAPSLDATKALLQKGYTPMKIFQEADKFFTDLGLLPLTETFWNKSMLERPADGRKVQCHPSAEDFALGKGSKDFRIKQCTKVNMDDFLISHHECGHIQYFMQYSNLHYIFRQGANPGFHEAIGDALALAVTTPKHLRCVLELNLGLNFSCKSESVKPAGTNISEMDINYLYRTALEKFAFFPFVISLESWRWEIFDGKLKEADYNRRWWELRKKNQGIIPPSERPLDAFDPAAKYHIVANVPYIRYFVSYILQFQFYEAMCKISGEFNAHDEASKPLYQCDFSGSKKAGKLLGEMMKLGFSKPWPEALKVITGSSKMSIQPLLYYFKPLLNIIENELSAAGEEICFGGECQKVAKDYLENKYEKLASAMSNKAAVAKFAYNTDLNNPKLEATAKACDLEFAKLWKTEWKDTVSQFDFEEFDDSDLTKRQLKFLSEIGESALSGDDFVRYNEVVLEMIKLYGTAKVCPFSRQNCDSETEGLSLEPDLQGVLSDGKDYDEMTYVWKAWRDSSGKLMKNLYNEFIELSNKAAVLNGHNDAGDFWIRQYESDTFKQDMEVLWQELEPIYKELHAYVRYKLSKKFPQVKVDQPIPAHLLGNMWSQTWDNIYHDVVPFPNSTVIDISNILEKKFSPDLKGVTRMFDKANEFFLSLGLLDMKVAYGPKAMIVKPKNKEVICHASAWDLDDGKDFRIKMCTGISQIDFITIHHELGHIQYYLNYKSLPITLRTGANPGFHEAIGDVIALSVQTPKHMARINYILDEETSQESTLNYLMKIALQKVAFLPFGYLIDSYRWKVFDGTITSQNLTYSWLQMRNKYQGIVPPIQRSEEDFDAGAKYHVAAHKQYICYFVGNILQFQIYKALCTEAGQYPKYPLHQCDFYKSSAAGYKLKQILESGASVKWQELLLKTIGESKLSVSAMKEYFSPLTEFLSTQRTKLQYPIGWDNDAFKYFYA